ncbi:putative beta-lysine N-acetyltransferase [Prolixibacteraceae bacterium JC049]|nr:putative beta-lysine N-acetyltransferase [Prolixibacteraceae bacterium JC049]
MYDTIEHVGEGSIIQHGKLNDRVYLMKLNFNDIDLIHEKLNELVDKHDYSKLFCKVPKCYAPVFFAHGFVMEAFIPGFYNHKEEAFFVCKYIHKSRRENIEEKSFKCLQKLLENKPQALDLDSHKYSIKRLEEDDAIEMAEIYKKVFASYPFPIHSPEFIKETMQDNLQYYGIQIDGKLVALASSEIDFEYENAEMTDFATLPEYAGHNFSSILLKEMEQEMRTQGIKTLYTIARLNSVSMTKTFLRNDYKYTGTLINNTQISGKIESMNVLYKRLEY